MDSLNREKLIAFIPMLSGCRDEEKANRLRTDDEYFHQVEKAMITTLNTLTPRETKIALMRFGLEDGRSRTLAEVGQAFGITEEEARVYEATILRKLRHPLRKKGLYEVY